MLSHDSVMLSRRMQGNLINATCANRQDTLYGRLARRGSLIGHRTYMRIARYARTRIATAIGTITVPSHHHNTITVPKVRFGAGCMVCAEADICDMLSNEQAATWQPSRRCFHTPLISCAPGLPAMSPSSSASVFAIDGRTSGEWCQQRWMSSSYRSRGGAAG